MGHWIVVRLSMEVSDMKKFLINIAIFFALVGAIDFAAGRMFIKLQSSFAKGETGSEYYICNCLKEDILIMGSSRAAHHYVSKIFADSLGATCYNGGQDGNGIVMQYGRWKMISKHHLPKVIIYDIEPAFDLSGGDNERYIDRLKPYAYDADVKEYIASLFPLENLKLTSWMYRYNYKFLEIISDCMRYSEVNNGYKPQYGHIRQELIDKQGKEVNGRPIEFNEEKKKILTDLVKEAQEKGIKVILVSSPYWKGYSNFDMRVVKELAAMMNVPFIDYSDSEIRNNPDWFADSMHLNDDGAQVFTADLISRIKVFCGI